MLPQFFHHHQIDLAQRDGLNLKLISRKYLLNHCFLSLLRTMQKTTHIWHRFSILARSANTYLFRTLNHHLLFAVNEPDAPVSQALISYFDYFGSLLGL